MAAHGKDGYFSVDGDPLPSITQMDLSQSVDTAESSVMGIEAKTYVSGLSDATISVSGVYDSTASTGADVLLAALVGVDAPVAFEYGPEGNGSGKVKYSGTCILTGYDISTPIGDVVSYSAEFQVSGAVTKGTFSA